MTTVEFNYHKEKCKALKKVRKTLADSLGVNLPQKECTFDGECKGTCQKCKQEEEILNRALLTKVGTAVATVGTAFSLSGCTLPDFNNNQILEGTAPAPVEELSGDVQIDNNYFEDYEGELNYNDEANDKVNNKSNQETEGEENELQ